jgi:hypothetical protein
MDVVLEDTFPSVPKDEKLCVQNVAEISGDTNSSMILDSTDVSMENEDQTVFDAKEKCIDTVFERTLQTDQGKVFGLQNEKDFNAQHIDASLEDYSVKSTETSLDASDGNINEAVADGYDITIALNTSLANITKRHPGSPTIEVPVEDIPPDPDAKKRIMGVISETTIRLNDYHGKASVPNYVTDFDCMKTFSETKALLVGHSANGSVNSSDNGESGKTIPVVDPSRLADHIFRYRHSHEDAYGDLVSFIQATTDVLDEVTTNDIYTFLEAMDGAKGRTHHLKYMDANPTRTRLLSSSGLKKVLPDRRSWYAPYSCTIPWYE